MSSKPDQSHQQGLCNMSACLCQTTITPVWSTPIRSHITEAFVSKEQDRLAGPFLIRRGHTRCPVVDKTYAAVFVSMATKAVHLDLCASLFTEDFRATLTRFVSKMGCPSDVYSDNDSNFLGGDPRVGCTPGLKVMQTDVGTLCVNSRNQYHQSTQL